jgi:enoyl-CoA hydratase/carnithine racemase
MTHAVDHQPEPDTNRRDLVLVEHRDQVMVLTLNRPDRLNAWTSELEARYFQLLEEAEANPDVRAVVVTGAGRGFCAGADMADLAAVADGQSPAGGPGRERSFPLTLRLPLIAAINGAVVGLGLVEALYCDVRFSVPSAKFSTMFARRGLIAEYGISWLLPRIVGHANALDLLLSGRMIDGNEAHAIGLVNRVVESGSVVEAAVEYAQDIATYCSPRSMATIKAQVQRDHERSFLDAYAEAEELFQASITWPDIGEGVASYEQRRPPKFAGLAQTPPATS